MRSAIFVDAGYLYAQGSVALAGHKLPRANVELDLARTVDKLRETSAARTVGAPLLRIYWYDGMLRGELSREQQHLAYTEDVKLRLGVVNQAGQQKGVDSLIVTDLVELARNQAIADAVLLSGDEDLRIGVQIAQSFGVRVHLIGIEPSWGSQSLSLLQEADTTTEWNKADVSTLMTLKPWGNASGPSPSTSSSVDVSAAAATLELAVGSFVASLNQEELRTLGSLEGSSYIPFDFDRKLLATCGTKMDKLLSDSEKAQMRRLFKDRIQETLESL